MIRFSDEWKQRLLDRCDIVDVVGDYLTLTKRGSNYWAPCPWHHERNPSFCVNPSKQMFYCFSCKKGGGVINFIMEYEKLSFPEAVTLLAERAGLPLPEETSDTEYAKRREYKKRLCAMMREAALYYHAMLKSPEGAGAMEYIMGRGVGGQVAPFGLGYAPRSGLQLQKHLAEKGYKLAEMLDAGLVGQKDGRTYDMFRGRVMFPIQNVFGDVIAFGGRVIGEGEPKYLNSHETVIFNKRHNLYALNTVKKRKNLRRILLVEGYMDVVALAGAGVRTAVASLGTSLTREQAKLLKRHVDGIYLCYDGDDAGLNAASRAVDILAAEGLGVDVMVVPEKLDPDEYVKKYGVDAFYGLAKEALEGMRFKLWHMRREFDMESQSGVVKYATKAVALIRGIGNVLERERYIKLLAADTGIAEQSLLAQMGIAGKDERYNITANETNLIKKETEIGDETRLLSLIMEDPMLLKREQGITEALFTKHAYKKIFLYADRQIKKGILPSHAEIISVLDDKEAAECGELASASHSGSATGRDDLARACIARLQIGALKEEKQTLLDQYGATADGAERANLVKQISEIDRKIRGIG